MFRFHIDIPLSKNEDQSKDLSIQIVEFLRTMNVDGVELIQYRLGNDSDRGNKNYLLADENGHCTTKKLKIEREPG